MVTHSMETKAVLGQDVACDSSSASRATRAQPVRCRNRVSRCRLRGLVIAANERFGLVLGMPAWCAALAAAGLYRQWTGKRLRASRLNQSTACQAQPLTVLRCGIIAVEQGRRGYFFYHYLKRGRQIASCSCRYDLIGVCNEAIELLLIPDARARNPLNPALL